jgi:hypothetical protein
VVHDEIDKSSTLTRVRTAAAFKTPFPLAPLQIPGHPQSRKRMRLSNQSASSHQWSAPWVVDTDPTVDQRTGLKLTTTARHQQLLEIMCEVKRDHWGHLQRRVAALYPEPSSQRTMLASALGAVKRQEVYGCTQTIPLHKRAVQDRLNALDRQIRLHRQEQPVATREDIQHAVARLSPLAQAALALVVCTAHRGTSIANLQWKDVVMRAFPPWLIDNVQASDEWYMQHQQLDPRSTLTSLRFRDGKTAAHIGTYTIHAHFPETLTQFILGLRATPPETPYVFGKDRHKVLAEVSRNISLRTLIHVCEKRGSRFSGKKIR